MANVANRSPWQVKLPGKEPRKFRLKSQALGHLQSEGIDPTNQPKNALKQLETAFEVQIKLKDGDGNIVKRTQTLDSRLLAEKWATEEETRIKRMRSVYGGFDAAFETITVRQALEKLHETHYKGKPSFQEIGYRIPHLAEWLGPDRLFRDLNKRDMSALLEKLKAHKYSASSIRNYFTVLTTLYKKASKNWHFPVENVASGLDLPKPKNAIQRYWVGDEKDRLMTSLALRSPWLIPIVELSLEMAFRRGELVQLGGKKAGAESSQSDGAPSTGAAKSKPKRTAEASGVDRGGLKWEHINWSEGALNLPKEKNDHTKKATEFAGRSVPITEKMKEILLPLYEASPTKSGLVFQGTTNSVTSSFHLACEKADPPIVGLTFHSLRKIATKNLSHRVNNPMDLGKLTGHKNIEILNSRYYGTTLDELAALLKESSGTLQHRGISALTKVLGLEDAKKFIDAVRHLKSTKDAFK